MLKSRTLVMWNQNPQDLLYILHHPILLKGIKDSFVRNELDGKCQNHTSVTLLFIVNLGVFVHMHLIIVIHFPERVTSFQWMNSNEVMLDSFLISLHNTQATRAGPCPFSAIHTVFFLSCQFLIGEYLSFPTLHSLFPVPNTNEGEFSFQAIISLLILFLR
jgi:hypothetical protein